MSVLNGCEVKENEKAPTLPPSHSPWHDDEKLGSVGEVVIGLIDQFEICRAIYFFYVNQRHVLELPEGEVKEEW